MQRHLQEETPSAMDKEETGLPVCCLAFVAALVLLTSVAFLVVGCLSASGRMLLGRSRYLSFEQELERSILGGNVMLGASLLVFIVGMFPACIAWKLKLALRSSDNCGSAHCHQNMQRLDPQPSPRHPHEAVVLEQTQSYPPVHQPLPYPIMPQLSRTSYHETPYQPIPTVEPHPPSYEEAVMEATAPPPSKSEL